MGSRKIWAFLAIIGLMLSFGCIEYHYSQTVKENGDSKLTLTVDYARILEKEAFKEGKTLEVKIKEFAEGQENKCKELVNKSPEYGCEVDGAKVIFSEDLSPGDYYEFTKAEEIGNFVYVLEIKKIPNLNVLEPIGEEEFDLEKNLSEEERLGLLTLKELGAKITYTIEMPGDIEEAYCGEVNGKINKGTTTFDLFEVSSELPNEIVVKSKKVNEAYTYLGVVLLIAVIAMLAYIFMRKPIDKGENARPLTKKR